MPAGDELALEIEPKFWFYFFVKGDSGQLEWVKKPQQARSQKTLDRLLDAAEALVLEEGAEAATVAKVARRAGSSVGAFYARFPDKEALLRCVFERFFWQAIATIDSALAPGRWDEVATEKVLESAAAFLIRTFRERRHLVSALSHRAASDPELAAIGRRIGDRVAVRCSELLHHRRDEVGHPQPELAVRLAVWMVMSALQSRTSLAPSTPVADETLAREITRMCLSYLGLAASAATDAGKARAPADAARSASGNERES